MLPFSHLQDSNDRCRGVPLTHNADYLFGVAQQGRANGLSHVQRDPREAWLVFIASVMDLYIISATCWPFLFC